MDSYVITISNVISEEDGKSVLVSILTSEYSALAGVEAECKGFKRVFIKIGKDDVFSNHSFHEDRHIQMSLSAMHANSPIEFFWAGLDKKDLSKYIFWGVTSFTPLKLKQPEIIYL